VPSIIDSTIGNATSGTAVSVAAPSSSVGNVAWVVVMVNTNTTIVDNNGSTTFDKVVSETNVPAAGATAALFRRVLQSGDPSTFAFTSGATGRWTAVAFTTDAVATPDDGPDASTGGDLATPTAAALTTTVANTLHVVACMADISAATITGPSGYTLIETLTSGGQCLRVAYASVPSAGSVAAQTFGPDPPGFEWVTFSWAVAGGGTASTRLMLLGIG